jgi:hypothetical protein
MTQTSSKCNTTTKDVASAIGLAYGRALTEAISSSQIAGFRALFADGPVMVVLQNASGDEAEFTIADDVAVDEEEVTTTMTWNDFAKRLPKI